MWYQPVRVPPGNRCDTKTFYKEGLIYKETLFNVWVVGEPEVWSSNLQFNSHLTNTFIDGRGEEEVAMLSGEKAFFRVGCLQRSRDL